MQTITLRYGLSNKVTRSVDDTVTIGDLLSNSSLMATLNAPEGVRAVSGGVTLSKEDLAADYPTITLEKQASEKG